MPIISRRVSLLLLTFSFFLVLAPALFSPPASAQESPAGEAKSIIPMAIQWGVGGIMFTVWLYQFKKSKKDSEDVMQLYVAQLKTSNETTKLAFEKYNEQTQQLIQLLKTNQEQNIQVQKDNQETTSLLTGTLSRLEVKLAVPVMCPLKEFSQIANKGAQG